MKHLKITKTSIFFSSGEFQRSSCAVTAKQQSKMWFLCKKFKYWHQNFSILPFSIHFHKSFHFISFWKEIQDFPLEIFRLTHKFLFHPILSFFSLAKLQNCTIYTLFYSNRILIDDIEFEEKNVKTNSICAESVLQNIWIDEHYDSMTGYIPALLVRYFYENIQFIFNIIRY